MCVGEIFLPPPPINPLNRVFACVETIFSQVSCILNLCQNFFKYYTYFILKQNQGVCSW